jgi:hypothetical protein
VGASYPNMWLFVLLTTDVNSGISGFKAVYQGQAAETEASNNSTMSHSSRGPLVEGLTVVAESPSGVVGDAPSATSKFSTPISWMTKQPSSSQLPRLTASLHSLHRIRIWIHLQSQLPQMSQTPDRTPRSRCANPHCHCQIACWF